MIASAPVQGAGAASQNAAAAAAGAGFAGTLLTGAQGAPAPPQASPQLLPLDGVVPPGVKQQFGS